MGSSRFHLWITGIMCAAFLFLLAVRYATPVEDGDLYWNMAYGKYLIENRTLIPDHTIFSWTPADNSVVKNEWFSEIALFLIHKWGGLNALFTIRYLFILLGILLFYLYTKKLGQKINPLHMIIIPIMVFSCKSGTMLKPEMFSLFYYFILAFLLFSTKLNYATQDRSNYIYFIPLLFLIWINSHGVVIFSMAVYSLFVIGELLNYFLKSNNHITPRYIKHQLISAAICFIAFFLSPYGYRFPKKLIDLVFFTNHANFQRIVAYKSILTKALSVHYYLEYWLMMTISLLFLLTFVMWKRKKLDFAILLPNIMLAVFYVKYARATYHWPAFWAYSVVYLSSQSDINLSHYKESIRKIISFACLILLVLFTIRIIDERKHFSITGLWLGFGIGYFNPVQESHFIKQFHPGSTLYNSYSNGGYLIWDLYPAYKVFIDPRYFPYTSWIKDYEQFNSGDASLQKLSEKYPFDVAVLDYLSSRIDIEKFNASKDWRLVYYGPSSAVFVKNETGFDFDYRSLDKKRFEGLKNLYQAELIFVCSMNFGDYETSQFLLDTIKREYSDQWGFNPLVLRCELAMRGIKAYENKDYVTASKYLEAHGRKMYAYRVNRYLADLRNHFFKAYVESKQYENALAVLKNTLQDNRKDEIALFNMAILVHTIKKEHPELNIKEQWREYLKRLIKYDANANDGTGISQTAQDILKGDVEPNANMFIFQ